MRLPEGMQKNQWMRILHQNKLLICHLILCLLIWLINIVVIKNNIQAGNPACAVVLSISYRMDAQALVSHSEELSTPLWGAMMQVDFYPDKACH